MNSGQPLDMEALRASYEQEAIRAERLRRSMIEQLDELFVQRQVVLGVPLESRVKQWASLEEKIQRKSLALTTIAELKDLVGIRVILLFRQDIGIVGAVLRDTFEILEVRDAAAHLSEVQFGYQSQHYVVALRRDWLQVPSFSGLGGLRAEIQVRTLAQHIWAAASHKLQYKQEDSVPPPLRRTIHRVSALLETVDLEFERVLNERRTYIDKQIETLKPSERLNVDLVNAILAEYFPSENKSESELYAMLLEELFELEITTAAKLRELLQRQLQTVLADEAKQVKRVQGGDLSGTTSERAARGVYYSYVGLARTALRHEFGTRFGEVIAKRYPQQATPVRQRVKRAKRKRM
jgi:putative GTP pyrophosphokinase